MQEYDNSKETLDQNGLPHSYNDQPSSGSTDTFLVWYLHGLIHRDGDKPAMVNRKNPSNQVFFQHGLKHRDGDKPAQINELYKVWYICNTKHRLNGPAQIKNTQIVQGTIYPLEKTFFLYGKELSAEAFQSILSLAKNNQCPLWFAFLYELQAISKEEKEAVEEMTKNWSQALPIAWILRALNMEDDRLSKYYSDDTYEWGTNNPTTGTLDKFIKIIEFESNKAPNDSGTN